jgi:hypothetical protein
MESAFYLFIREKMGNVTRTGEAECDTSDTLQFNAKKPPEVDCGNQSGECSQPFTLPTPDWMLALHDPFSTVLRTRVVG